MKFFTIRWPSILFLFLMGFSVGQVHAAIFRIPEEAPRSAEEIEDQIDRIKDDLSDAQCGGWDLETSVENHISEITGAPGREGIWDGNLKSGLAKRIESYEDAVDAGDERKAGLLNDGYTFPPISMAKGYSTACRNADIARFARAAELDNCQNPENCFSFCADLNRWQYRLNSPVKNCEFNPGNDGRPEDWLYCCTDERVTEYNYEAMPDRTHPDAARNCIQCQGDGAAFRGGPNMDFNEEFLDRGRRNETGCRLGKTVADVKGGVAKGDVSSSATTLPIGEGGRYQSFFRQFFAEYERDAVPGARGDNAEGGPIEINCYGLYEEVDGKVTAIPNAGKNCVIAGDFSDRKLSQVAKGDYEQDPPNGNLPQLPRPYDEDTDVWFPHIGDAISLLNGKQLEEKYQSDITFPLLSIDNAGQKPVVQISQEQKQSDGNILRAFDDTIATYQDPRGPEQDPERRTIVTWWQALETQTHTLFTPPVVHLLLPSPWGLGLDPLDPFLAPQPKEPISTRDPQTESIEIQLQLKEDLLGEIVSYLKRSYLLQLQEEKVSVAVPMGSPTEFRAIAEAWCTWYKEKNNTRSCMGSETVAQLEAYAARIDEVRSLRAELALTTGILLERQRTIMETLAAWLKENIDQYNALQGRFDERLALKPEWEKIQDIYRSMHDDEVMGWCRNDRYTLPIYSLLDPWMPGRPVLADGPPYPLPRLTINRSTDLILDFSKLAPPDTAVKIPVLNVIQVKIDPQTIAVPRADQEDVTLPELPDLPPVPTIAHGDLIDEIFPEIEVSDDPARTIRSFIPAPDAIDLGGVQQIFVRVKEILTGMKKSYRDFVAGVLYQETGLSTECQARGELPCVYDENELKQILQRLTARPLIFLKEDFQAIGERRNPAMDTGGYDGCPDGETVCHRLSLEKTFPKEGWLITGVRANEEAISKLQTELMMETLARDEDERFPFAVPEENILPSFHVPERLELSPAPPS